MVEDGCADRDPEVHSVLTEKVFPRQGTVVSSREMVEALQQAGERVWSSIDSGVAESVDELSPQTFPDFEQ